MLSAIVFVYALISNGHVIATYPSLQECQKAAQPHQYCMYIKKEV